MTTEAALLDTSVLISLERGELVDILAGVVRPAVSVITLAELKAGVVAASGTPALLRRMRTLEAARELVVHHIDERVADAWVLLRSHLAESGGRAGANDLWIAATAVAAGIPLLTHDAGLAALEGVPGLTVLRA